MKNSALNYVVFALAVCVPSAALTTLVINQANSDGQAELDAALEPGVETVSVAEFNRLIESIERLRERVLDLEARPNGEVVERVSLADEAGDDFEAEVREFMAAVKSGKTTQEYSVPKVAEALEVIREEERAAKEQKWEEQRLAKQEAALTRITEQLQLSGWQTDEFRTLLTNRHAANVDLKERWEAGEDPAVLGQEKEANRLANEEAIARVLSPQQLESYRALQGERGGK